MNRRTVLKGGIVLAATAHSAVASGDEVQTSSQDRIIAAMAEIEQAMSEMYPGWSIENRNDVVCPLRHVQGGPFEKLPANMHAIVVFAHDDSDELTREFRWHVHHTDRRGA